jgi:hypothetical protein
MRGEVMVMVVRLTTMFTTWKDNMGLITDISIMWGVEVEVILPHDHQHIPNPVMNVSKKSVDTATNFVIQCTLSS